MTRCLPRFFRRIADEKLEALQLAKLLLHIPFAGKGPAKEADGLRRILAPRFAGDVEGHKSERENTQVGVGRQRQDGHLDLAPFSAVVDQGAQRYLAPFGGTRARRNGRIREPDPALSNRIRQGLDPNDMTQQCDQIRWARAAGDGLRPGALAEKQHGLAVRFQFSKIHFPDRNDRPAGMEKRAFPSGETDGGGRRRSLEGCGLVDLCMNDPLRRQAAGPLGQGSYSFARMPGHRPGNDSGTSAYQIFRPGTEDLVGAIGRLGWECHSASLQNHKQQRQDSHHDRWTAAPESGVPLC